MDALMRFVSMQNRIAGIRMRVLIAAVLVAWLPAACATATAPAVSTPAQETGLTTYRQIKSLLDQSGNTIDYDTLMQIHEIMVQSPHPIAHADQLLRMLSSKRNDDPRIDQMILIFSAKTIGRSRYLIPDAHAVFESILQQEDRINDWVIAFVAEAIGDYAYDLPEGDKLVDFMEAQQNRVRLKDHTGEEQFGYHFLPPPKSVIIRTYLSGITDQAIRQSERNRYYLLIFNKLAEKEIESALTYLKTHGAPGSGERCPLLMQCVMRYSDRLSFQ